jgi:hypothetical protein
MKRTKHVIAVVVVATALCADRSLSAAPVARSADASSGLARSFASKLTSNLRRAIAPTVSVQPTRSDEQVQTFAPAIREEASGVRISLSPYQFRLPPPML